tara:strand:- start:1533 stop:2045 length:513 start_codon:yes stop_codon:yes gene_type:complete
MLTLHANGKIEGINNSNFNSSLSAGQVIQTVYNHTSSTAVLSYNETWSQLQTSITPSSTSSSILVMVSLGLTSSDSAADVGFDILRDSTALQIGSGGSNNSTSGCFMNQGAGEGFSTTIVMLDDEISTTSQVTYKIRANANNPRNLVINKRGQDTALNTQSRMTLMEISG